MYRKHYKPSIVERSCSQLDSIPISKEEYRQNVEANYLDHDGCTNLHLAVIQDNDNLISRAIKAGCDVNAADKYGRRPMHLAAEHGSTRAVRKLLMHGAELNVYNNDGLSPLMVATRKGHVGVMRSLLHGGAKVNSCNARRETALHYASAAGCMEAVEALLASKASVEVHDAEGVTPLMQSAKFGHLNVINHLVKEAKADLNAIDLEGSTVVHYAIKNHQTEALQFLIEQQANLSVQNKSNMTPFVLSIFCNHCEGLRLLLAANVDRTIDGLNGTPLTLAALKGHSLCVRILIDHGEEPDEYGYFGMTPLMSAAFEGHVDVIDTLLNLGADPDYPGRWGSHAIHKCLMRVTPENAERRQKSLIRLIRAGADVNPRLVCAGIFTAVTCGRNCPLSFALMSGYISMAQILLRAGVQLEGRELCEWVRAEHVGHFFNMKQLLQPIKEYLTTVKSLKHLCRQVVHKSLGKNPDVKLEQLPVAKPIQSYLNFPEFDNMPVERAGTVQDLPVGLLEYFPGRPCGMQTLEGTFIHQSMRDADVDH